MFRMMSLVVWAQGLTLIGHLWRSLTCPHVVLVVLAYLRGSVGGAQKAVIIKIEFRTLLSRAVCIFHRESTWLSQRTAHCLHGMFGDSLRYLRAAQKHASKTRFGSFSGGSKCPIFEASDSKNKQYLPFLVFSEQKPDILRTWTFLVLSWFHTWSRQVARAEVEAGNYAGAPKVCLGLA